jgi:hypothetical protein
LLDFYFVPEQFKAGRQALQLRAFL